MLAIPGYHEPGDLEALPALIREIEPAYHVIWYPKPLWGEVDIFAWVSD